MPVTSSLSSSFSHHHRDVLRQIVRSKVIGMDVGHETEVHTVEDLIRRQGQVVQGFFMPIIFPRTGVKEGPVPLS